MTTEELRVVMALLGAEYDVQGDIGNKQTLYFMTVGKLKVSLTTVLPPIKTFADHVDRLVFMRIFGVPEDIQDKLNVLMTEKMALHHDH
jgi:hypothetical protein